MAHRRERNAMIELIAILAIFGGGSLFARVAGVKDWALPAIGYISGLAILIGIGFIQIVLGLPSNPLITLGLTVLIPLVWWFSSNRNEPFFYTARYVLLAITAVIGLVCLFREANVVSWHIDSFKYLRSGALIAGGNYDRITPHDLQWRLLALPIIHAPANLAGEFYLRSATP